MRKIAILGSTGKIGSQALEVIRSFPGEFQLIGLACGHQSERFAEQVKEFKPKVTAVAEEDGEEKLTAVATHSEVDLVVVAVVGIGGLLPTLAAIQAGKDIALATKEVLVIAGSIVMEKVKKYGVNLVPIDSEHSAIFQSLKAGRKEEIKRLILTMGKGPIAKMTKQQLANVMIKDVFNRPTWSLGQKIAVDSATGMNKAFEVIEARWIFDVNPGQIEIIVHPEYLCHSLLEFVDGSMMAELGVADMRRYLQYALFYPQRRVTKVSSYLDIFDKRLTFVKPPLAKFPCLKLGHEALKIGGTMSAVMHGADTVAVDAFSKKEIKFTDIPTIIITTMNAHKVTYNPTLHQLIEAEKWGQEFAQKLLN